MSRDSGEKKHHKRHHHAEKQDDNDEVVSLVSKLSDVGTFSYSSLCGASLLQLFDDEFNRDFKKALIQIILLHLKVPTQVSDSVKAITEGEGVADPKPYADVLLEEPCLHGTGLPVITDLVTLSISQGKYDSRLRTLIKHVAWQLRVSWDHLEEVESLLAETLEAKQYEMSEEEEKEKKKKSRNQRVKRIVLIGLATVGGGAIIGLTGGLAAPLVAAGAGAIIGGTGAAVLGTTAGVAIIGSLFGMAGAGLAGYKMKKRFGAIEEFKFEPMVSGGALQRASSAKQLHITIAVTGWLNSNMQDCKIPWKNLAESQEQYCLRYESKHLAILGNAIDYFLSGAVSMATQEALKYTVLSGIIAAIAWPSALLSASNIIDNPWGVCLDRSSAAGKELAEALLAREQGNRPVTLIGYSLGARVIFSCLQEMTKRKCSEGIVEDVILLGAPVPGDVKQWCKLSRVVAGKIINGYSKADWLLKFLYRTSSVQFSVAGLQPIKWDDRRMNNIDLSDIVSGHGDYLKQLDTILKVVGIRTKQDIVKQPLTSHSMMGRKGSSVSYTSSEGESEDDELKSHGKSHDKSKSHGKLPVKSGSSQSDPEIAEKQEKVSSSESSNDLNEENLKPRNSMSSPEFVLEQDTSSEAAVNQNDENGSIEDIKVINLNEIAKIINETIIAKSINPDTVPETSEENTDTGLMLNHPNSSQEMGITENIEKEKPDGNKVDQADIDSKQEFVPVGHKIETAFNKSEPGSEKEVAVKDLQQAPVTSDQEAETSLNQSNPPKENNNILQDNTQTPVLEEKITQSSGSHSNPVRQDSDEIPVLPFSSENQKEDSSDKIKEIDVSLIENNNLEDIASKETDKNMDSKSDK